MAALLDRQFQRELLNSLSGAYPGGMNVRSQFADDRQRVNVNLAYLSEHGLVSLVSKEMISGEYLIASAKITASGLDFLADDGGLSAILGVVTIKLHEDTLKSIIIDKIANSQADETLKVKLRNKIKNLPAEALSTLTTKLLEEGFSQLPNAIPMLQRLLGLDQ